MLFLPLLISLIQAVAAVPAPEAAPAAEVAELDAPRLAKRGEGIHFVNCDAFGGEGTILPPRSYVIYCPNDSDCNHPPSADNKCVMAQNFLWDWEGQAGACTFPTGVRFAWFINDNAQSQPDFTHVGDGGNQFRAFTGFKDDKHGLFNEGPSQCHSIYYWV